ncbi:MAG: ATP-binding response regulator [Ignavibacteriaceae bacterium]
MKSKITILHLEDNIYDAELIEYILSSNNLNPVIKRVDKKEEFINSIEHGTYDLIISDNTLNNFTGLEALELINERNIETPFIFVSGTIGEEIAIESLTHGATDYVLKHRIERLIPAVNRALKEFEDKSKLKWTESELRKNEKLYRLLTENASDLISKLSSDGIFLFASRASKILLGIETMIGKSIFDIIHPEEVEGVKSILLEIPKLKTKTVEYRIQHLNGSYFWCESSFQYLETSGSINFHEMIAVIRDISERKNYESELLKSKAKADEMNLLKSNLLANMSHEFRTPLNGIIGFAEILKSELKNKSYIDYSSRILSSGKRLLTTLSSILNLSAFESEVPNINLASENLVLVVDSVVETFNDYALNKELKYEYLPSNKIIIVNIDKMLFEQALTNIIDNAFKFTLKGKITVSIKVEIKNNTNFAVVSVADTGIGISEINFDYIFKDFKQVSEGYSRKYEGLGLGLPVAKRMLELIGGEIVFESKVEIGSAFHIYLPLTGIKINDSSNNNFTNDKPNLIKQKLSEILYVEDNEMNYILMKRFLKDRYIVVNASNGEIAIELISKKIYPIILMDINLGSGMNGIDTLKIIKQDVRYSKIPVVAVTGYALPSDRDRLLDSGFNNIITKPFTKEEIINLIKKSIGESKWNQKMI